MQAIHEPLSTTQRMQFHSIFSTWLTQASDDDCLKLSHARELVPSPVCSAIQLVQNYSVDPELAKQLPSSLTQLLASRKWPHAVAASATA